MKKIYLWMLALVVSYQALAQSKLIITDDSFSGEIYEANLDGSGLTQTAMFPVKNRMEDHEQLIKYGDDYYGISSEGGKNDQGVLYRYRFANDTITVLHHFTVGSALSLVGGPDSVLYGTSRGSELFRYDLKSNAFSVVGNIGGSPIRYGLMLASDGKLYGITNNGGNNNRGVIYRFDPTNNSITVLHHVNPANDGRALHAPLVEANNGLLYGSARLEGANGDGTLFSINPATGVFTTEVAFDETVNGGRPEVNLIEGDNDLLYGVLNANGTQKFFSFDPTTNQIVLRATFDRNTTGEYISQISEVNGNIYGHTSDDAANGSGALVKYSVSGDSLSALYQFGEVIGELDGMVLVGPGNELLMYSGYGNTYDNGAIITINTVTKQASFRLKFNEYPKGRYPQRSILQTSDNRFFGLTSDGGKNNAGTLYEYLPATKQLEARYHFSYDSLFLDNNYNLTEGPNGLLYGSVKYYPLAGCSSCRISPPLDGGGLNNVEAYYLFSFNPTTYELKTFLNFNDVEGNAPVYLTFAGNDLYGVVSDDGLNNRGGVFHYNLPTEQYDLLFSFDVTTTGRNPVNIVIANGVVYGINNRDGANGSGTIYKYDIANNQVTVLKSFIWSEPWGARFGLIQHSNGKIYSELANRNGSIIEVDPTTDVFSTKILFPDENLRSASGTISEGSDGKIYGVVRNLNDNAVGFYTYDPDSDTFTDLLTTNKYSSVSSFYTSAVCVAPLFEEVLDTVLCVGQPLSVAVGSSNTNSYVWKKDGVVLAGQTTDSLKLDVASTANVGTYTAVLENACGQDSVTFTLSVSDIQLTATAVNVTCNGTQGGSINVDASGGTEPYQYSLDGTDFQSEASFAGLSEGNYTVTVQDAGGCSATVVTTVSQSEALSFTVTGRDETCELGFIAITASGGVSPYEYSLDGQTYQSEGQLDGVAAGEYIVHVRDVNGCIATETHTVGQVAALQLSAMVSESTDYPENGSIALNISGGSEPYSIVWNTGDSIATISDLVPDDYTVTVTDKDGCTADSIFTVGGVTSIADLEQQGVRIYPNPVVDQLQIRLPSSTAIQQATLYGAGGEVVRQYVLQGGPNQLSAEGIKPGVYLLQLSNGTTTRLVIQ